MTERQHYKKLLNFCNIDGDAGALSAVDLDFSDEANRETKNSVDELSTPTATFVVRVPEGDVGFEFKPEGGAVVGTKPKLHPLEAYALVLGHRRL